MAQHDYIIANGTGAAVRSDLNGSLAAIVSNNSGATEPGTMYAYQWWADTTTGLLKIRNAANNAWVTVGTLASTNLGLLPLAGGTMTGVLAVTAGTAALPGIAVSGDLNTGLVSPGADQLAITTGGTSRLAVSTTAVSSTLAVDVPLGAVGTPSLTFTGDLNTGIWSPAAGTIAFSEGGAEAMRIDSSSRLLVGTSTARSNFFNVGSLSGLLQIEGLGNTTRVCSFIHNTSDIAGPLLVLGKSRGTTAGANTVVVSGDELGVLSFQGADGSELVSAAEIRAEVDGTPSANDMPGRLVFSTTADGASTPTERMRIASDGAISSVIPGGSTLYPQFGCRAWVNFNGTANTNLTGTYSQSGTTVTVTATAHGLIVGSSINADITSGTGVDGIYTVTAITDANTFTYTAGTSLTTSGNITLLRNTIRASGNVSSITDNGTGDYTVNFTTAMVDANYAAVGSAQGAAAAGGGGTYVVGMYTGVAASQRVAVCRNDENITTPTDVTAIHISIFR